MTTENMANLSGTIKELLILLQDIDNYIGQDKQPNDQMKVIEQEKNNLQLLINELSGKI